MNLKNANFFFLYDDAFFYKLQLTTIKKYPKKRTMTTFCASTFKREYLIPLSVMYVHLAPHKQLAATPANIEAGIKE